MASYAVVNTGSVVVNIVSWDGVTSFNVAPNTLVATSNNPNAQIGGTYSGGVFTPPIVTPTQGFAWVQIPTTGQTLQIPPAVSPPHGHMMVILQPAATLALLTLNLPLTANDDDRIDLYSTKAITSLAMVPPSGVLANNMPTSLAANAPAITLYFSAQYAAWFQL